MKKNTDKTTTHFGFQQIPTTEKNKKVAEVFHSVADKYDLMNDLMSLGIHRLWKQIAIHSSRIRAGDKILDLAGGTGDLTMELAKQVGKEGEIYLADINQSMLEQGRNRLLDNGLVGNIHYIQVNAECLPFVNNYFNHIIIGFGLRNVTHKEKALKSMYRVLKPGGQILILEFSKPVLPGLQSIYDLYSFKMLPLLGKLIADDETSYRYLAESICMHPDQETLKNMMQTAGFEQCSYNNLSGGIVAIHRGYKL